MIAKTETALGRARREAHEACPHRCVNHADAFDKPDRSWQWLTGCGTCGIQHAAIARLEAAAREEDADHDWRRQMEAYGYDSVAKVGNLIDAARFAGRLEQAEKSVSLARPQMGRPESYGERRLIEERDRLRLEAG